MPRTGRPPKPKAAQEKTQTWRVRKAANARKRAGAVPKFKRIRTSVPNIEAICRTGIPGYDPWSAPGVAHFDKAKARSAIRFFEEELTHTKGPLSGKPFKLERWERAIIGNLFGWLRKDDTRRYRESLIYLPRKNGKTTLAAGIILYCLFEDDEYGSEIYGAASEYKQASLVYHHARGMVLANPKLKERCQLYAGQVKSIQLAEDTGFSTYRVISSKDDAAHGFNVHAAVVDELHTQPDSKLVDALMTGTGARRQPLLVYITTADYMRESVCNTKYAYAKSVRDGTVDDPSFLPVIFEASADADWRKPETWKIANPNLGVSLYQDYLERECARAIDSPAYENTFRRLHLNQRTEQDVRWLSLSKWDACDGEIDPGALKGCRCFAGLDLASTTDLAAFVLFFPDNGNAVLPFFWVPEETAMERERKDRAPYLKWAKQGLVSLTSGNVVDQEFIRQKINDLQEVYEITDIAVDPWNSTKITTELGQDGFDMVPFQQGFKSMTSPTKELEALVISGNLRHGGHPILRWMAANVSVELDAAGNLKPSRKKSSEKIDGIVALIMAIGRWMLDEGPGSSVYEGRGLLTL